MQRADSNGDGILSVEEYHKILQEHNIRLGLAIFNIKVSISMQNSTILQRKNGAVFNFSTLKIGLLGTQVPLGTRSPGH